MAAPQDAVVTVSGSVQKFVTKKKKVLSAEEAELYELAQAAGIVMDQEVFKILVDLLKMNVAPLAVFQMLKSMCAGHRLTDSVSTESSSPSIQATHTETRGKTKLNPANTIQGQSERSSREGSSQRVPRQPSASRMQKSSSSGKSSGGSST
ncbi:mitotic-spindle organizing protein 2B-like isoform X2 [Rana temporaria]|uniref:mitotic-spindle organizing protein 2B-like isoform X2 n=1 Tax=Rana temporaria TaxID=8407 RepID=UPI001AAD251C|nr:mitotic-spindle organizing protein 2B-like isoform X2 [Rana temporaria]